MYRSVQLTVAGAYDSSLKWPIFGPLNIYFDNVNDLQAYNQIHRVNATDTEFTVPISSLITASYFYVVVSDYPVLVRLVGASTTQFTMHSNNVAVTNIGSPVPDQCVMFGTCALPNNYMTLAPITGAVQTATVKVFVSGDPLNAYT